MRIAELAAHTGVAPQTIRFYERRGLLPTPEREPNGYREYAPIAAARLAFIRSAQTAGLTLTEIAGVLAVRQADQAPCEHVTDLLARKLDEVHRRQHDLALLETELQELLHASDHLDPDECTAGEICHIITRQRPDRRTDGPSRAAFGI